MKKFIQSVLEWKTWVCLAFTAYVVIYGVIGWLQGEQVIRLSCLFNMLLVACLGTLAQYVCFTDRVFRRMRYSQRLLLFGCLFLPALIVCNLVFSWFPADNLWAWAIFAGLFLGIFAVMTGIYELSYRIAGKKYDGLLGQYKREREEK